ncbi:MAG TPA: peptidase, partial [Dehalococcoidia bacterium]|nr:peptidase [Dehalococcoidia bacterium]
HVALLTGRNAAALIGRHEGPYPGPELRDLLNAGRTLPRLARLAGRRVAFANAFTPVFHDRMARGKARWSAFGLTCELAGLTIRGAVELAGGRAVSSWPTNRAWAELGHPMPVIDAIEAGRNLARLALDHDLTLYEYFACDFAGHRADRDLMVRSVDELDQVVAGAWPILAANGGSLVIVSDHGNVEDWTIRGHTLGPATFVAAGPIAASSRDVSSLTDVAPAMLRYLGVLD